MVEEMAIHCIRRRRPRTQQPPPPPIAKMYRIKPSRNTNPRAIWYMAKT